MSLLILIYWFVITRWDSCAIENRKIINRLFGFITLRNIAIEDVILVETDSEMIAKEKMPQKRGNYDYLRITYHNRQKNKEVRYIITPDDDEIFKNQIELMQKMQPLKCLVSLKN